ncbi:MAG TPA: type IV conjugative transfer system coupling protein TraD [Anaerolineae bacterium]|nr:type IV conjugative transfer system coupling protein TraD [Anaerolineae bacterium]
MISDNYPVEALLRPPVEYFAAAAYFAVAIIILSAPELLMMVPVVSYAAATLMLLRGGQRFLQAFRVRRYQKGLRRLPYYRMSSSKLPVSNQLLFLGKGFSWDQRHTQRLADLERYENRGYKVNSPLYRLSRRIEYKFEHARMAASLILFLQKSRFSPVRPLPPLGGNPALHGVGLLEGERDICISLDDRNGHMLVLGTTRVGKTRLLEIIAAQDIRRGDVTIVFDPKGDADVFRRMFAEAIAADRLDNFFFFHLGYPDVSARYNPVGNFSRVTEVASRIAGQLPGEGQSQAFREFVWRYVNVIAKALTALGRKTDYGQIKYYGEDIEGLFVDYLEHYLGNNVEQHSDWVDRVNEYETLFKIGPKDGGLGKGRGFSDRSDRAMALHKYFKDHEIRDPVAHSLIKTFDFEKGYLDKLVGSLLPLMEKLCTGKTAELLSPNYEDVEDPRPIFDWPQIIRTGGIVYVGLDALSDPEVAAAVGNSMFADLTSVAGRQYKHGTSHGVPGADYKMPRVSILCDEFNELIGDEFIPLLNKAGGAGFQVTVFTQTWSDVIARLNDQAKAGQVGGNLNTLLMLRVKELATAELLTKQLKDVEVNHLMTVSAGKATTEAGEGTNFSATNESRNTTQKMSLIHPQDLTQLSKGQCFGLVDGGKPVKIRLPLPDNSDLDALPENLELIARDMQDRYTTSDSWYQYPSSLQEVT